MSSPFVESSVAQINNTPDLFHTSTFVKKTQADSAGSTLFQSQRVTATPSPIDDLSLDSLDTSEVGCSMKPFPSKQFTKLTLTSFRGKERKEELGKTSRNLVTFSGTISVKSANESEHPDLSNTFTSDDHDSIEPTYAPFNRALLTSPDSLLKKSVNARETQSVPPILRIESLQQGSFESISDTMSDQSIVHSTPKNSSLELIPDSHSGHNRNSKFDRSLDITPISAKARPFTPSGEDSVIVSETPEGSSSSLRSDLSPCPNRSSASLDLIYPNTIVASPTITTQCEVSPLASVEQTRAQGSGLPTKVRLRGTRQDIIDPSLSPSQINPSTTLSKKRFNIGSTVTSQTPSRLLRKLYRRSGGKGLFESRLKSRLHPYTFIGNQTPKNLARSEEIQEAPLVRQEKSLSKNPSEVIQRPEIPTNFNDRVVVTPSIVPSKQNEEFQEPSLSEKPWIDLASLKRSPHLSASVEVSPSKEKSETLEFQVELRYTLSQDLDTSISQPSEEQPTLKLTDIPIPVLPSQSINYDSIEITLDKFPSKKGKAKAKNPSISQPPSGQKESSQQSTFESSFISPTGHEIEFIAPCSSTGIPLNIHPPNLPLDSVSGQSTSKKQPSSEIQVDVPDKNPTETSSEQEPSSASWLATTDLHEGSSVADRSPISSNQEIQVRNADASSLNPSTDIVYSSQHDQGSPLVSKAQDLEQHDCFQKPASSPNQRITSTIHNTLNNHQIVQTKETIPDSCDLNDVIKGLPIVNPMLVKSTVKRSRENEEGSKRPTKRGKSGDSKEVSASVAPFDNNCFADGIHEGLYSSCPITTKPVPKNPVLITPSPTQISRIDIKKKIRKPDTDTLVTPPSSISAITQSKSSARLKDKTVVSEHLPHHVPSLQSKSPCNDDRGLDRTTTVSSTKQSNGKRRGQEETIKLSATPSLENGSYPTSYGVDERVWARWEGDSHYYSATILAVDKSTTFKVKFDDGDEGICEAGSLRPLVLLKNTVIFAVKTKRHMFEAKVISPIIESVEQYEIEFVDESRETRVVHSRDIIMSEHMLALLDRDVVDWEQHRRLVSKNSTERKSRQVKVEKNTPKEDLFQGLGFLITNIRTNNSEERKCGGEESIEGKFLDDFERSKISAMIKQHGGTIISDFSDIYNGRHRVPTGKSIYEINQVFVIASSSKRTKKYLMALALGVPRVSSVWVAECARQNSRLNHLNYLLCNGWSRELNAFASSVPIDRDEGLFSHLTVYIHGSNTFRSDWESTLEAGGASILSKKSLSNHSVNLVKPIICDYVISEKAPTNKFLETVRRRLRCSDYLHSSEQEQDIYPKLVTAEWAVQCLINQRLTEWNRHEAYTKWESTK